MKIQLHLCALLIATALMAIPHSSHAQQSDTTTAHPTYIRLEVLGLACPFCAYGLEKDLRESLDAHNVHIVLKKGYVYLTVPSNHKPTEQQLKDIVRQAGFTPGEILLSSEPFDNQKVHR